jgi:hypothetical protein
MMSEKADLNLLDLPNEVLLFIFSKLCYRSLARIAQANKKCCEIVRLVWQAESKIDFGKRAFIYESNHKNDKLKLSPTNFLSMMETILKQTNIENIKKLDVTFYCQRYRNNRAFNERFVNLLVEYCKNVTHLNLAGYVLTYDFFIHLPTNLTKLVHLDLRASTINDYCLTYILNDCLNLSTLNLNNCVCLKGIFVKNLYRDLSNLKFLYIDYCDKIDENTLIEFLGRNGKYLTGAFHSRTTSPFGKGENFFETVLTNVVNVQSLALTCSQIEFSTNLHTLKNLVELDLSQSHANNNEISLVLNNYLSLRKLSLNLMRGLLDEAFTKRPISAPISCLELCRAKSLTDFSIQAIGRYLADSLNELNLSDCQSLSSLGVEELLKSAVKLKKLDLSLMDAIMDARFLNWLAEESSFIQKISINFYGCVKVQEFLSTNTDFNQEMLKNRRFKINYKKVVVTFHKLKLLSN